MKLAVISHKLIWSYKDNYYTDGGFPNQMEAISELFSKTIMVLPMQKTNNIKNKKLITGKNIIIYPINSLPLNKILRRIFLPIWLIVNFVKISKIINSNDAIHAPIPGDIGTIGMIIAFFLKKPLFVRYCGNWVNERTYAEKFWRWFLVRYAGGENVFLATGGDDKLPSKNKNLKWIFSTSLSEKNIKENYVYNRKIINI